MKCPKCDKETELMYNEKQPEIELAVCHDCKWIGTICEIYSRCVGYLRPISGWNKGKKEEFKNRKTYKINKGE